MIFFKKVVLIFIYLFIHQQIFMSVSDVPGTISGAIDIAVNKLNSCHGTYILFKISP